MLGFLGFSLENAVQIRGSTILRNTRRNLNGTIDEPSFPLERQALCRFPLLSSPKSLMCVCCFFPGTLFHQLMQIKLLVTTPIQRLTSESGKSRPYTTMKRISSIPFQPVQLRRRRSDNLQPRVHCRENKCKAVSNLKSGGQFEDP